MVVDAVRVEQVAALRLLDHVLLEEALAAARALGVRRVDARPRVLHGHVRALRDVGRRLRQRLRGRNHRYKRVFVKP